MKKQVMSTQERLQAAAEAGEILEIVYQGGRRPGTLREIAPLGVESGRVIAKCFISNSVESFAVDKIVIVDSIRSLAADEWHADVETPPYESLLALRDRKADYLIKLGWHIEGGVDCLYLHSRFKNGRPKKVPDVSLTYREYALGPVAGSDRRSSDGNRGKRLRPWSVSAKNKGTRTFGSLDRAAEVFLEWASLLAPVEG